ncbi:hypothetical protein KOM00_02120 [Geomonas sp. Red69]|uniref:Lipoprotein n=1 Tax=Geomonas diazotrophica TaxID=2843197 RepID=A0ABX8JJS8_9BACT|nr:MULTISPECIES: hypothetical protein [Geomonas]MBU5635523.1 hypothetical protein [Geomonas diazotrophica]QWV97426.1 hypothetical protein KP005_19125 [Geomonas nitrogeniifigens]QXE86584.1 hypothetical protein KP003_19865 [Geomonas nitrogeniifigens]
MKKKIRYLIALVVLPSLLSACVVVPFDDYYRGQHHGGYYNDYDGRYGRGPYGGRR